MARTGETKDTPMSVLVNLRRMITRQAVEKPQAAISDNIEENKGIHESRSDKSN